MKLALSALLFLAFLNGCSQMKSQQFYEIDGFYVFPLKQIKIGDSRKIVKNRLGNPKVTKQKDYI